MRAFLKLFAGFLRFAQQAGGHINEHLHNRTFSMPLNAQCLISRGVKTLFFGHFGVPCLIPGGA